MHTSHVVIATTLLFGLAAHAQERVVVFPVTSDDVKTQSLARALSAGTFALTSEHGLVAVDVTRSAFAYRRALACKDDACRREVSKSLGARYSLIAKPIADGAEVRMLDVEDPTRVVVTKAFGTSLNIEPRMLTAVDELLEDVAPRARHTRTQALARASRARAQNDNTSEEASLLEAISALPLDDEGVNLAMVRARRIDTRDKLLGRLEWIALSSQLNFARERLSNEVYAHAATTAKERLLVDAEGLFVHASNAESDTMLLEAALLFDKVHELFDDNEALVRAAEAYHAAHAYDAALATCNTVLSDENIDAEIRVRALVLKTRVQAEAVPAS